MNRYPKVGEKVRILNNIGKDFVDDMIAVVDYRDGEYVYVRTLKKRVLIERYVNELEPYPPEDETPGEQADRWSKLYVTEPGTTKEYRVVEYGSAARIRTSHYGVELWRYRFSWDSDSVFHDIDVHADAFDNLDDFIEFAENKHTTSKRRIK